jgi:hypothetical protein
MTTIGDFRKISKGGNQLEAGEHVVFPFELPENLFNAAPEPQGYVIFDYYASGAQNLIFMLTINGHDIDFYSGLNGTQLNHNMELINSDWLLPGVNKFEVSVEKGSGVLHIYESVIHYHLQV